VKIKFIFFFSSFFHLFSYANADCTPTTVGFFNGMLNNRAAASKNFAQIQVDMYSTYNYYNRINFPLYYVLFYNNTNGISKDLNEVFTQLKNEADGRTPLSTNTKQNYEDHEELAVQAIKANHGLMLIGHSQGNFFLNYIYEYCERNSRRPSDRRCSAIQIGSPTSKQYGQQFLSEKDLMIKGFFAATGRTFNPTLKSPYNPHDATGHGLINTYLAEGLPGLSPRAPIVHALNFWTGLFCPYM